MVMGQAVAVLDDLDDEGVLLLFLVTMIVSDALSTGGVAGTLELVEEEDEDEEELVAEASAVDDGEEAAVAEAARERFLELATSRLLLGSTLR